MADEPMPDGADAGSSAGSVEIACPHCRKRFSAELIAGSAERYRGFKCPHCRLFVPAARVS
jgi:DNA-directed RNA polymerase subunit RPC12/RpoP